MAKPLPAPGSVSPSHPEGTKSKSPGIASWRPGLQPAAAGALGHGRHSEGTVRTLQRPAKPNAPEFALWLRQPIPPQSSACQGKCAGQRDSHLHPRSPSYRRRIRRQQVAAAAVAFVGVVLTVLSLSHLAHGIALVTSAPLWEAWAMAVGWPWLHRLGDRPTLRGDAGRPQGDLQIHRTGNRRHARRVGGHERAGVWGASDWLDALSGGRPRDRNPGPHLRLEPGGLRVVRSALT